MLQEASLGIRAPVDPRWRCLGCFVGGAAVVALAVALGGCGAGPLPATGTLTEETFHSAIVGDDYTLRIRVPPGYEAGTELFPLVVQLDPTYAGLEEYARTVGLISHHAASGAWDEAIVIGVDYPDPGTRERDYTLADPLHPEYGGEGADRFHRVLDEEILPAMEARYRIDGVRRSLVGHSKGGVFAWYAAFRHTPPEAPLFSGMVAADCGYEEPLFTLERWHAERSQSLPMRIYASRAVFNGASQQVGFDAMMARVRARGYAGLALREEVFETDHAGAVDPSFEAGLAMLLGRAL